MQIVKDVTALYSFNYSAFFVCVYLEQQPVSIVGIINTKKQMCVVTLTKHCSVTDIRCLLCMVGNPFLSNSFDFSSFDNDTRQQLPN